MDAEARALRDGLIEACRRLGVECRPDFIASGARFPVYLPHFGGPSGMVVGTLDQRRLDVRPLYLSLVNAQTYSGPDPAPLKEALEDWGWFGPQHLCPDWYAGFRYAAAGGDEESQKP